MQVFSMQSSESRAVINPLDPVYTIGTAAKRMGVSAETLRLYEREGLVIPYRTRTGRRMYSQKDLEWIACIRRQIKEKKFTLSAIRGMLSLIPCWEIKPCSIEDRNVCPAYLSSERVCWKLDETGERCAMEECRTCKVYLSALKMEHPKEFYRMSLKHV